MIGTDVTMDGLRRYAKAIHEAKRVIHIDIPEECEQKLQSTKIHPSLDYYTYNSHKQTSAIFISLISLHPL